MMNLKQAIFKILLLAGKGILLVLSILSTILLYIGTVYLIGIIQKKMFLPQEYIMWIFKYPFSILVFIFEFYIIFGFFYTFSKYFREAVKSKANLIKKCKISLSVIFISLNIVIIYTILFDVTVITPNRIIDYTFLTPQGKVYEYNDIVKINTGIYGRKSFLPFAHYSRGDFYYIIQLKDGTKIDLTDVGGVTDDEYTYINDIRFIIEKLDRQFVNLGIPKLSSMDNFEYCTEYLDKIYTDKIKDILLNIK